MKLIVATDPGVVELNYMWLPTWIGMNPTLKKELETELEPMLVGQPLTEELIERAHQHAVAFLVGRHPEFEGLRDYLDAIKFVDYRPAQA